MTESYMPTSFLKGPPDTVVTGRTTVDLTKPRWATTFTVPGASVELNQLRKAVNVATEMETQIEKGKLIAFSVEWSDCLKTYIQGGKLWLQLGEHVLTLDQAFDLYTAMSSAKIELLRQHGIR